MKTLKASLEGLDKIKKAIEKIQKEKGWALDNLDWLDEASKFLPMVKYLKFEASESVSIGTWKRFRRNVGVKPSYFQAFCQVLGLNWEEVVDNSQYQSTTLPVFLGQDWGAAPPVSYCYGRTQELNTLKESILQDKCNLILLLGQGGIGKTTLSIKLAKEIENNFDYIIWRSLEASPSVEEILADAIKLFSNQQDTSLPKTLEEKITKLIHYLESSRCLLILDNAESILQSSSHIGQYREGYQGYGDLLKRIAQSSHRSCLLITSREKPEAIDLIARKTKTIQSLELDGLNVEDGRKIFTTFGVFFGSEDDWNLVIEHYAGNPFALEVAAEAIQDLLGGNLSRFVKEYLGKAKFTQIDNLFERQFGRLSDSEKEIMYWLAINYEPISDLELKEDIISWKAKQELLESLASLKRRLLIKNTQLGYTQIAPFREYIINRLINEICQEIKTEKIELLKSYSLCKATSKDYIRETQVRQIITLLLERLIHEFGGKRNVENILKQITSSWQQQSPQATGYLGGNILNLLCQLNTDNPIQLQEQNQNLCDVSVEAGSPKSEVKNR